MNIREVESYWLFAAENFCLGCLSRPIDGLQCTARKVGQMVLKSSDFGENFMVFHFGQVIAQIERETREICFLIATTKLHDVSLCGHSIPQPKATFFKPSTR